MSTPAKAVPALFASAIFLSSSAQALAACSQDRFVIDGIPVTTSLCTGEATVAAGTERLPLHAHFTSAKGVLDQDVVLRFPAQAPSPHAVEDFDLATLGIAKTLHVSLRPAKGSVEIVRAILLPGPKVIR